jgi:pilus assembly protein CpaF
MSIRRFGTSPLLMKDLLAYKALTPEMAMLVESSVKARLNIIICGGTGSGKTTLLNALSCFISPDERVVTIEDAAELQLQQPHVVQLESRPANVEGKGQVTIRDLLKNALRMRPDRIVIGECRGGETLDMLQAMNTGHEGSLTTLHANTPRDGLSRMETMIMMSGFEMPVKAMRQQICSALDLIIQTNRLQGGGRRVTTITEVMGMEGDMIVMQDIFQFRQTGVNANGEALGQFESMGVRPSFMPRLKSVGIEFPPNMFETRAMLSV